MLRGLEAIFVWDRDGSNEFDMNDTSGYPRVKLRRIGGLTSLGDSEDVRELAVGRAAEIARRSFRRGKTITFEGALQAQTLSDLRELEGEMRAAFHDQLVEKRLAIVSPPFVDPPEEFFLYARSLGLEIDESQGSPQRTSKGWERNFVLSIRQGDSRYYDDSAAPSTITLFAEDADDTDTDTATHNGDADADPVLTLTSAAVAISGWTPVDLATVEALHLGLAPSANYGAWQWAAGVFTYDQPSAKGTVKRSPMIDGVALWYADVGTRILVKDEEGGTSEKNGIYVLTQQGGNKLPGNAGDTILTRATDADAAGEFVQNKVVQVTGGATNSNNRYKLSNAGPYTVNTTNLTFVADTAGVGIRVANVTTGGELLFPGLALTSGHEIVVDFRTRRVTFDGEPTGLLDAGGSTWWDSGIAGLAPGPNTIELSSIVGTVGADFDVTCEVAWLDTFV